MKFSKLKPLKKIQSLQNTNKSKRGRKSKFLDSLETISYSTNLCYYSIQIIRSEIKVSNKDEKLSLLSKEIYNLNNLLMKNDYILYSNYTNKDKKDFFKKVGLKTK